MSIKADEYNADEVATAFEWQVGRAQDFLTRQQICDIFFDILFSEAVFILFGDRDSISFPLLA